MAAHHSLDLNKATCDHYYHCIIYDVPFTLPVSQIAEHVSPQPQSSNVRELAMHGGRIVPHQLHLYKENMNTKFGYVSYFVHHGSHVNVDNGLVHRLVLQWIEQDLTPQLLLVNCHAKLGQPTECHSSEPFLAAFNRLCPILNPETCIDSRKMETFLLSRVEFNKAVSNASLWCCYGSTSELKGNETGREEAADRANAPTPEWQPVGTVAWKSLRPKELIWLKKELKNFPPLLVTAGDMNTTTVDGVAMYTFLERTLRPLFTPENQ